MCARPVLSVLLCVVYVVVFSTLAITDGSMSAEVLVPGIGLIAFLAFAVGFEVALVFVVEPAVLPAVGRALNV